MRAIRTGKDICHPSLERQRNYMTSLKYQASSEGLTITAMSDRSCAEHQARIGQPRQARFDLVLKPFESLFNTSLFVGFLGLV